LSDVEVDSLFRAEVARGFSASPKTIDPRYFYDELGSALFDAICRLPWYAITRTENRLLRSEGPRILAAASNASTFVELGGGNGEKLSLLLEAARSVGRCPAVSLVDISRAALELSRKRLARFDLAGLDTHEAAFEPGLRAALAVRGPAPALVIFLGSNIGNLDFTQASGFLAEVRRALAPGDSLLLGADLLKPEEDLVRAYDDPLGVTAAFNKNLLVRINRELGGDFDLDAFAHRAVWNAAASRVEMHLVARRALRVTIPGMGRPFPFEEGESIHTESSYKYEPESLRAMVEATGYEATEAFTDSASRYTLALFRAVNHEATPTS
jgi:dimethylhistidine N-methyltransferase